MELLLILTLPISVIASDVDGTKMVDAFEVFNDGWAVMFLESL